MSELSTKPNVVFVFADQWRAQSTGYNGDPNVHTPHLDALAGESINLENAISSCPVCSPYRGSLITGRYPLSHGVFMNDVHLSADAVSIAEAFADGGYDTAYIGKWHLDGRGRSAFIPREARQGFDFWKVLECTHDYNNSHYYGDTPERLTWEGYDAIAQTREAERYIREHDADKPFFLVLSWGPPHNPFHTAPERYEAIYRTMLEEGRLELRPNVPDAVREQALDELSGYCAHITALDDCIGDLVKTLADTGLDENTVLVFTSDHGEMLGSHAMWRKQKPWDESMRVPFLLRYPERFGRAPRKCSKFIDAPDIMPTLLSLCDVSIPDTVEGKDLTSYLEGAPPPEDDCGLVACYAPFGEFARTGDGKEYRGVRTARYTYARDLEGPWLLYDNERDPYQLTNLCRVDEYARVQDRLERLLKRKLEEMDDAFLPGSAYIEQWGYPLDKTGTVPYTN